MHAYWTDRQTHNTHTTMNALLFNCSGEKQFLIVLWHSVNTYITSEKYLCRISQLVIVPPLMISCWNNWPLHQLCQHSYSVMSILLYSFNMIKHDYRHTYIHTGWSMKRLPFTSDSLFVKNSCTFTKTLEMDKPNINISVYKCSILLKTRSNLQHTVCKFLLISLLIFAILYSMSSEKVPRQSLHQPWSSSWTCSSSVDSDEHLSTYVNS